MRHLCITLLILTASLAPAQQVAATNPASSGKLSIPAQLTKTLRADKAHIGDPVEFKTLEAVLVGKDTVMPANSLLHGRILSASPKQDGKNSWLALVVERAEWKEHSLPLHAFVVAQIAISAASNQRAADPGMAANTPTNPRRTGRQSAGAAAHDDPSLSNLIKSPQDATQAGQDEAPKYPKLDNVGILRDKDGTTYLLSSKTNVKLPAGALLMLRNEPAGSSEATDAKTATNAPGPGQPN